MVMVFLIADHLPSAQKHLPQFAPIADSTMPSESNAKSGNLPSGPVALKAVKPIPT
jgi:hypothetical protein